MTLNIFLDNLLFFVIVLVFVLMVIALYFIFIKAKTYPVDHQNKTEAQNLSQEQFSKEMFETKKSIEEEAVSKNELKQHAVEHDKTPISADEVLQMLDEEKEILVEDEPSKSNGEVNQNDQLEEVETKEIDETKESQKTLDQTKEVIENGEQEKPKEDVELGKYHILYRDSDDRWYVKREGSEKVLRVLHTKKEAIAYATIKAINQDTNIVIHAKDGKIEKHGY